MSNNIDNRVVNMQFNNRQFESNVQTSIKSLNDLKKGLQLEDSARSLSKLDRAGKSFSLNGIATGVEAISSRVSTLGIMGMTMLQNLTNSAINAGKRIVSALTIDPIGKGYEEYETKMNAIQTILTNTASKGTTLKDVNKSLNELNEYADKTIYNFAEMTRNIGTFTAAGVDLKTSVTSIKGIANLAAGSGSSAIQASTAMYQLSQAIAAGSVKLMDWNSVVNAGMGGELFQKALEKTALQLGHGRDMSVSFRESLEKGWITTEVLTKTLAKFANDESLIKAATQVTTFTKLFETMKESVQSGWAQSWEAIIGNKSESTSVLTAIGNAFSEVVGGSAEARNEMLAFWKANGGRTALIEGLANALIGLSTILEPIEKAFRDIFPAMTAKRLIEISKGFRDLMSNFKMGEEDSENLRRTFRGLFAVLDIGKQALFAIGNGLISLIKYFSPAGSGLLSFTGNIGDFLVALNNTIKTTNIFNLAIQKVGSFLKPVADGVKNTVLLIINAFKQFRGIDTSGLDSFSEKIKARFEPFTKMGDIIHNVFTKIANVVKKVSPIFYKIAEVIGNTLGKMSDNIVAALDGANYNSIFDIINSGLFAAILLGVRKFINSLTQITNNGGSIVGHFADILDGVKGSLASFQSQLKANVLMKIAIAIGILSASLLVLSTIDPKKLAISLSAMTTMFVELFGSMAVFEKIMGAAGFVNMGRITVSMIGLSAAILVLSFAMKNLAALDWQGIQNGLIAVAGLSGILILTSMAMEKNSLGIIKGATSFIIFGAAINILAMAVKRLGELNTENLTKGLISVGLLMTGLALFMNNTNLSGMGMLKGVGFLTLAAAISVLANAVMKFVEISPEGLEKGLIAMGLLLGELALFVNLTGNVTKVISTAIGLTIIGAAMLVFSKAIGDMGKLSWEQITKGLVTLTGALTIVTIAMLAMTSAIPGAAALLIASIALSGAIFIISKALINLSKALSNMGGMSWEQIAKGLVALAGSLVIIAISMAAMTNALPGAAALLVISAALSALTPVLKTLSGMSLSEIGKGLLALAGMFTVIGLAGLVLSPLIPSILGLSAAITLLGIGCLAVGGGLLAFSAGLAALAVSGAAGSAALVVAISAIVGLIPFTLKTLATGFVDFIRVLGEGIPIVAKSIKSIVVAILEVLNELVPLIIETIYNLMSKLIETMLKHMPKLVESGMKLLDGVLKGIANNIENVTKAAVDIVVNFLNGVASKLPDIIQAGFNLSISFTNGLADGIRNNAEPMKKSIKNLVFSVIEVGAKALKETIAPIENIGKQVVTGFVKGIKSKIEEAKQSASELGQSVINSAKSILGIHSPSKLFKEIGEMVTKGMTKGIDNGSKDVIKASENMSKKAGKSSAQIAKESSEAAKKAFDKSVEWIDDRKYYNKLSLREELVEWEKLQTQYVKYTELRKKADREIYRVKQEILKQTKEAEEKAYKDGYERSVNWIDDRKYYQQMALSEELAAWERIQARYKKGTEERKKADREVFKLQNEINKANEDYQNKLTDIYEQTTTRKKQLEEEYYNKTQEINAKLKQDIQSVNDEYKNALDSRKKTLYDTYGLFDKIDEKDPISGAQLADNLRRQIIEFDTWQKSIKDLVSKGVDEGLIKELQDMGPKSVNEIKALTTLSKPELDEYIILWKMKHAKAHNESINELESLRIETLNKISELNTQANIELEDYRILWHNQTTAVTADANVQLTNLKSEWLSTIGSIRKETERELESMTENIRTIINKPKWQELGENIINGITSGVEGSSGGLFKSIVGVGSKALNSIKSVLGIHSPSKEFEKVGMYANQGLINGLSRLSGVMSMTDTVGNSVKNTLRDTLSNISNIISSDLDNSIVIRPVLDLSNVEAGRGRLYGMFSNGINVASNKAKVDAISTGIQTSKSSNISSDGKNVTSGDQTIINEFKIGSLVVREEADVKKIARELRGMQKQNGRSREVTIG